MCNKGRIRMFLMYVYSREGITMSSFLAYHHHFPLALHVFTELNLDNIIMLAPRSSLLPEVGYCAAAVVLLSPQRVTVCVRACGENTHTVLMMQRQTMCEMHYGQIYCLCVCAARMCTRSQSIKGVWPTTTVK